MNSEQLEFPSTQPATSTSAYLQGGGFPLPVTSEGAHVVQLISHSQTGGFLHKWSGYVGRLLSSLVMPGYTLT